MSQCLLINLSDASTLLRIMPDHRRYRGNLSTDAFGYCTWKRTTRTATTCCCERFVCWQLTSTSNNNAINNISWCRLSIIVCDYCAISNQWQWICVWFGCPSSKVRRRDDDDETNRTHNENRELRRDLGIGEWLWVSMARGVDSRVDEGEGGQGFIDDIMVASIIWGHCRKSGPLCPTNLIFAF